MKADGLKPASYIVLVAAMAQFLALLFGGSDDVALSEPEIDRRAGLDMSDVFEPVPEDVAIGDLIEETPSFALDAADLP